MQHVGISDSVTCRLSIKAHSRVGSGVTISSAMSQTYRLATTTWNPQFPRNENLHVLVAGFSSHLSMYAGKKRACLEHRHDRINVCTVRYV